MSDNNDVNMIINKITDSSEQEMHDYMMEAAELFLKSDEDNGKQQCLSDTDMTAKKTQQHMMEMAELFLRIDGDSHEQENEKNCSNEVEFQNFVNRRLDEISDANGGQVIRRNANMRRNFHNSHTSLEHRGQNNAAAQRSRDRKRMDDLVKTIRLEYLELKNYELKSELEKCNDKLFLARNLVLKPKN